LITRFYDNDKQVQLPLRFYPKEDYDYDSKLYYNYKLLTKVLKIILVFNKPVQIGNKYLLILV